MGANKCSATHKVDWSFKFGQVVFLIVHKKFCLGNFLPFIQINTHARFKHNKNELNMDVGFPHIVYNGSYLTMVWF